MFLGVGFTCKSTVFHALWPLDHPRRACVCFVGVEVERSLAELNSRGYGAALGDAESSGSGSGAACGAADVALKAWKNDNGHTTVVSYGI